MTSAVRARALEGNGHPDGGVAVDLGMAVDLGVPSSRGGSRGAQSLEGCVSGLVSLGDAACPMARGPMLPWATAAQADGCKRPVRALGVHHMAWPVDMHRRRGRHRGPPLASYEP